MNSKSLLLGLMAGLVCVTAALPEQAKAHGAPSSPVSRALKCLTDGGIWSPGGSAMPSAACRQALLQSPIGATIFTDWHANSKNISDFNNPAAVRAAVPNGLLCSAGQPGRAGQDSVSPDWHRTSVVPQNGQIQLDYMIRQDHLPSFYEFYLSKPTYHGDRPLTWDDLELVQKITDSTVYRLPGSADYRFPVTIPQGREGDAVIYTRWQRMDGAGEAFFACS